MKSGKYWQRVSLAMMAFLMAFGALLPNSVSAASSAALSIPPKKEYSIKSGENVDDKLQIRNLDDTKPLELTLKVIDFTYDDDSGSAKFMLDENAPKTSWSLRDYMSLPDKVTVEPGASKSIPLTVAIPKEVGAGSYYSAIMYVAGSESYNGASNVGISPSVVTLVFATVPGKVNEKLTVKKFGAYREATAEKGAGFPYFNLDEPKAIGYTLKNDGNVTESPVGTITMRSLFGQEYLIKDINPAGSLALIGQTRTFRACIRQKADDINFDGAKSQAKDCTTAQLWPGLYRVSLSGYYGYNGNKTQEFTANASFWYLPMWFIFAFLIVLIIVGYFIWSVVERIRGRGQYRHNRK